MDRISRSNLRTLKLLPLKVHRKINGAEFTNLGLRGVNGLEFLE
jgi:hypothetical protein